MWWVILLPFCISHTLQNILSCKTLKLSASNIFMLIYEIWMCEEIPKIHVLFIWINEPIYFLCTYVSIDHKFCLQYPVNHLRHTNLDVPRHWSWRNPRFYMGDTTSFGTVSKELIEGLFPLGYDKLRHSLNRWSNYVMIAPISPWRLHAPLIIIHNPGF